MQINHKLEKILEFAITKNANTLNNHEDFNRVVTGLRVKVRGEQIFLKMRSYKPKTKS